MAKTGKRLAVLSAQLEEIYQQDFIKGFERFAFDKGFDVCIFAMYQKFQESKPREIGESKIYDLVNCDLFDGILVMGDMIQTPGVLDHIEKMLSDKARCPVLFVDSETSAFPCIELHHYEAIVKLTEHLIKDHGYRDIAMLTGKKWHVHSTERLNGFLDTMKANGLVVGDDRVFYGDFWYASGRSLADMFVKEKKSLPEAFICANDYMAIGLASRFEALGVRVPEDVAVVGYDSVKEGRESPRPVTSIPLPSVQYGEYAARKLTDLIEDRSTGEFSPSYELFRGASCGCHCESLLPKVMLRSSWDTDDSKQTYYSTHNRLLEDMYSTESFEGAIEQVRRYVNNIDDFDEFHICVNSPWINGGAGERREDYTEKIYEVISDFKTGTKNNIEVSFDNRFNRSDLLPDLSKKDKSARAYIFTPLHFDSNCFGYAAVSYGSRLICPEFTYTLWLRNIMLGLESLRRQDLLATSRHTLEEIRFTDPLTNLNNYDGFVRRISELIDGGNKPGNYINIIAVDITGLGKLNEEKGRKAGDRTIVEFSKLLPMATDHKGVFGRLGNDEFVVAGINNCNDEACVTRFHERLDALVDTFNEGRDFKVSYTFGNSRCEVNAADNLERLISEAVSVKNGNKMKERRRTLSSEFNEEEENMAECVRKLLDENLFDYHFQPIVDTHTGNIFAYEALMRPLCDPYISPLAVIEYAGRMGRLEDIESLTFLNILRFVEQNKELVGNKKIFLNSIPGVEINDSNRSLIIEALGKHSNTIVIELTEHSELDDGTLEKVKNFYNDLGIQSAVDDYGTGYSNVVNLLRYMPDYVKIDRMLLAGIEDNPQKQHFVKEIVTFAHENSFKVLSEGVETSAELETCIRLGADYIQGFYTARPQKELIEDLDPLIREEIFRYYSKYSG